MRSNDDMDVDQGDPFSSPPGYPLPPPILPVPQHSFPSGFLPSPNVPLPNLNPNPMFPPINNHQPSLFPSISTQASFPQALQPPRIQQSPFSLISDSTYSEYLFSNLSRYPDDQEIVLKPISAEEVQEEPVRLELKSAYSPLELRSGPIEVPCMISLIGETIEASTALASRSGIDLVCVIDISGSMGGRKIQLVIETLNFLLTLLNKYDRMSLVLFDHQAYRVCPLSSVDGEGLQKLQDTIKNIRSMGGTSIHEGLRAGLRVLEDRRIINQVTSILLLTDGIDNLPDSTIDALKEECLKNNTTGFSVHTFGYGADHKPSILNAIAGKFDGNFYYVENEEKIAEAFANCLGELASLVAEKPVISIQTQACPIEFSLAKVYSANGDTQFEMPSILSSSQKDSIFILHFPGETDWDGELICPVRVKASFTLFQTGEQVVLEDELQLTVNIPSEDIEVDKDVMVNFYRVKSAETLKEIIRLANNNQYANAQALSIQAVAELKECVVKDSGLVKVLIKDLEDAGVRSANQANWNRGGFAQASALFGSHSQQKASINSASYQNCSQQSYCASMQSYFGQNR